MSARFCTVCGAVLRHGACPNGHPQRAARRARPRGRFGQALALFLLLGLLAGGVYAGLVEYPGRAAAELMQPSSREFADALEAYRSTVGAFPPGATDPQALSDGASAVLTASGNARDRLGRASGRLEEREAADLPVVSSRPPLAQAVGTREDMLAFYAAALEVIGSLEAASGYVADVSAILPRLDTLDQTLGRPTPEQVPATVAATAPIADQIIADLQALTPPDELGGLHQSLLAIAERIRADLDELNAATETPPVIRVLLQDLRGQLASFRETFGAAPRAAGQAGLTANKEDASELAGEVVAALQSLADVHGVDGLTIPQPL